MTTTRISLLFVASLHLCTGAVADPAGRVELAPDLAPDLEARLTKLCEELEAARLEAHIPGMSIAVVKDDEIVLARGFGLADVAAERAADEETISAIGSTTKACTATLIGMLVDAGEAGWDDPVSRHLPYFELAPRAAAGELCTLRDLLSHRHGFVRMPLLWFKSELTRREILETAARAEPLDDFRAGFHYSNVGYLAAGEAAGVAAGSSWDALIAERFFEPLGMGSSTVSVAAAQGDPRLALGYAWSEPRAELEPLPRVAIDNIGPAGSVNSSALDMAQWLRLQLGRGEVDGVRLISAERLLETHSTQIEIGSGVSYGLGWMLREHGGRQVVEHGGNIDGFSAQVALVPEENLGFVLLMNLDIAPLREPSLALVLDALLGELPGASAEADLGETSRPAVAQGELSDYTGVYIANFASFDDERFEVTAAEGSLSLDVPSQRSFELKAPNEEGRWGFALTDQIAVSFQRAPGGDVVGLTMHQGGFDFEVPREGAQLPGGVPVEELEPYTGVYVLAGGGKRLEFLLRDGRLYMNDKGKRMPFNAPDAEGHTTMRARADYAATFRLEAEGPPQSLVFHGDAGDREFWRESDSDADLPSVAELLALRQLDARRAALAADTGSRVRGTVRFPQSAIEGEVCLDSEGKDRFALHMDLGKFGRIDLVAVGPEAWRYTSMRGHESLEGAELAQALLEHPWVVSGDWNETFDSARVLRAERLDGRDTFVVRLTREGTPSLTLWVDAELGDILRMTRLAEERSMRYPLTITYSGHREVDGLRRPTRIEAENPHSGRTVLSFDSFESGLELGDEAFTFDDPEAED